MTDSKLSLLTVPDPAFEFRWQLFGIGRHKMAFTGNNNILANLLVPWDDGAGGCPGTFTLETGGSASTISDKFNLN
jgi:hypothetical protein